MSAASCSRSTRWWGVPRAFLKLCGFFKSSALPLLCPFLAPTIQISRCTTYTRAPLNRTFPSGRCITAACAISLLSPHSAAAFAAAPRAFPHALLALHHHVRIVYILRLPLLFRRLLALSSIIMDLFVTRGFFLKFSFVNSTISDYRASSFYLSFFFF